MTKIAVILSGCGAFDGAEIHESVLTLLAIEQNGASWHCYAPNINQHHVVNHLSGDEMSQSRNVLEEAARIARGKVQDIAELKADNYDALLVPGGFGAAKNLCDFVIAGANCKVQPDVLAACKDFARAGKPAGYICIAPMMLPRVYGPGVKGTIGTNEESAAVFNQMGGRHVSCQVNDFVLDEEYRVASTPAYMLAQSVSDAASGINPMVKKLVELAR